MALNCKLSERIFTFEGKDYSYAQFQALLAEGLLARIPELTTAAKETLATKEGKAKVEAETTGRMANLRRGTQKPQAEERPKTTQERAAEAENRQNRTGSNRMSDHRAKRLLGLIKPNLKIRRFAANEKDKFDEAYRSLTGDTQIIASEEYDGFYDSSGDGTVYLILKPGQQRVLAHEVMHPVFNVLFGGDQKLIDDFYAQLKADGRFAKYIEFGARYEPGMTEKMEAITDFLGAVADGELDEIFKKDPSFKAQVIEFIKKLLGLIGMSKDINISGDMDLMTVAALINDAIKYNARLRTQNISAEPKNGVYAHIFGPSGKLTPEEQSGLQAAMAAHQNGATQEETKKLSGWFIGPDDKWRKYSEPFQAKLIGNPSDPDWILPIGFNQDGDVIPGTVLQDIYDFPELYKKYPSFKYIPVVLENLTGEKSNSSGYWDGSSIVLNKKYANNPKNILGVIAHETQHAIQEEEGFSMGSNEIISIHLLDKGQRKQFIEYAKKIIQQAKNQNNKYTNLRNLFESGGDRKLKNKKKLFDLIDDIEYAVMQIDSGLWEESVSSIMEEAYGSNFEKENPSKYLNIKSNFEKLLEEKGSAGLTGEAMIDSITKSLLLMTGNSEQNMQLDFIAKSEKNIYENKYSSDAFKSFQEIVKILNEYLPDNKISFLAYMANYGEKEARHVEGRVAAEKSIQKEKETAVLRAESFEGSLAHSWLDTAILAGEIFGKLSTYTESDYATASALARSNVPSFVSSVSGEAEGQLYFAKKKPAANVIPDAEFNNAIDAADIAISTIPQETWSNMSPEEKALSMANEAMDAMQGSAWYGGLDMKQKRAANAEMRREISAQTGVNITAAAQKRHRQVQGKQQRVAQSEKLKEAKKIQRALKQGIRTKAGEKRDFRQNALIKEFSKLKIPKGTDLDAYMEIATALKSIVEGAKVVVTENLVSALNSDLGVTNAALEAYIDGRLAAQAAEEPEELLKQFEKVRVEQGLEGASLTLEDIKSIMASMEADEAAMKKLQKKLEDEQKMKMLQTVAKIKIEELKDFQRQNKLDDEDNKILNDIQKIDTGRLGPKEAAFLVNAINNIIENNSFGGARAIAAKGRKDAAIAEMQQMARQIGGFGSPGTQWAINKNSDQVAIFFEKLAKNPRFAAKLRKLLGFDGILNGLSAANHMVRNVQQERNNYADEVGYKDSLLNRYRMGAYAYAIQHKGNTPEKIKAEFEKRIADLRESAKLLSNKNNYNVDLIQNRIDPKLYIQAIEEVIGSATSANELNISAPLKAMVEWEIEQHEKDFEMHERSAERDHNRALERQENYTSTAQIRVKDAGAEKDSDAANKAIEEQLTKSYFISPTVREAPASAKQERKGRQRDQVVNINFFTVQDESRKQNIADSLTSQHIATLRETLADSRLAGDGKLIDETTKSLIIHMAKEMLGIDMRRRDIFRGAASRAYNTFARRSGGLALKGIVQYPKQMTVMVSTAFALMDSRKGIGFLTNGLSDASKASVPGTWQHELIKGRQIAERSKQLMGMNKLGDEISKEATLTGDEGKVMEYVKRGLAEYTRQAEGLNRTIAVPDAFVATASWFAFYRQYLNDIGVDLSQEGWKYEPNEDAASYANQMVERAQNANTPEAMPAYYRDRSFAARVLMDAAYAFSNFSLNMRKRLNRDITMLFTGAKEDKAFAARDLFGAYVETAVFVTISTGIFEFGVQIMGSLVGSLFGEGEDKRRKKKQQQERSFFEKVLSTSLFDFLFVGLPEIGANTAKTIANLLTHEKGKQDIFYVPKETSFGLMTSLLDEMATLGALSTGLITGEYGGEKLTPKQYEAAKLAAALSFFSITGFSDSFLTRRLEKETIKKLPYQKNTIHDILIDWITKPFGLEEEEPQRRKLKRLKRD